jgi:iron complex outermembrane receptor protein
MHQVNYRTVQLKNVVRLLCCTVLLLMVAMVCPRLVLAQQAREDGAAGNIQIEDIIVTAQRREESLQETPISISVFTTEELRQRNLTNLMEVSHFAPNVVMSTASSGSGGGNNSQIYIRGVGQTDFLFTTDPGVGIYMDGVYLPRTLGGVLDLLDIERVEILRGPQGILFGKNTIGGAINVISNKPTQEFGGFAELTLGSLDRFDGRFTVNVPLSETLSSRFAFSSKNRDGYSDRLNYDTGQLIDQQGSEDAVTGRASFQWTPSEATTLDIIFDYTREREESAATVMVEFNPNKGLAPLWNGLVGYPSGSPMTTAFVTTDKHTTWGTGPNHNDLNVSGVNVTLAHEFSDITFKSISAYREMDAKFGRDADGSPNTYIQTDNTQTQEQFSQEFQLFGASADGKWNWLAGAFFMKEKGTDQNDVRLASGLYDALQGLPVQLSGSPCEPPWVAPGCFGNPINVLLDLDFDINNSIDIKSYALFSQVTYQFSDRWKGNAGLRWSWESKDYTLEHLRVNSGAAIIPLTTIGDSWSEPSPRLGLDFQVNENILAYAYWASGYKSGGFNGRPTTGSEVEPFDPEYVDNYEIGLKTELADRRVRVNAAMFYMDYTDMQLGSVSADDTGNLILIIDNAGKAVVKGFEIDFLALPDERWLLSAGLGYTNAKYTDTGNASGITVESHFVKSPKWTANASAQYALPVGGFGELRLRADWSYLSKVYNDIQNTVSISQPAYSLFGARVTLHNFDHDYDVVLAGTNLSDEIFIINGLQALDSFGHAEAVFAAGRQWSISFSKNF